MSDINEKMLFPLASEYYRANPAINIGDSGIDKSAVLPIFHFGQQPFGLKDIDVKEKRNIAVIGCGSAYKVFSGPALQHRGTTCYIVDTADTAEIEKRLGRKLDPRREIKVSSIDDIQGRGVMLDYVAVLTPPEHHAGKIRELQAAGIPTMVEKPIVSMGAHLQGPGHLHDNLMHHGNAPLYAMDWEVLLATPLMAVLGMKPSFESIVEFGNGGGGAG